MDATPNSLDHVALWVADRDPLADFLCANLGMHEIERTDSFTLVGVDAKLGKLTLFDAEGPRDPGVLERVVLRVNDLDAALERLPARFRRDGETATFDAPQGLRMGLVEREGAVDYDLDHVILRLPDAQGAIEELAALGVERRGDALAVDDRELRVVPGDSADGERPLLNHLALLVDSASEVQAGAEREGVEIDDIKDAPNTLAVFVRGPSGVRIEYVEHKPGFSLV
jgi:catechol 2,3-dioxygenase-like lactoylglutathione lyase family enzyme